MRSHDSPSSRCHRDPHLVPRDRILRVRHPQRSCRCFPRQVSQPGCYEASRDRDSLHRFGYSGDRTSRRGTDGNPRLRPRHAVVKDGVIADDRRFQTVVVMAVVAGARTIAAAVERKTVPALEEGVEGEGGLRGDVMAIVDIVNDVAVAGHAITTDRRRRLMVGTRGMADGAIPDHRAVKIGVR